MISPETIAGIRFGMGLRPDARPSADPSDLLAEVTGAVQAPPLIPAAQMSARRDTFQNVQRLRRCARKNSTDEACRDEFRAAMGQIKTAVQSDLSAWIARMVGARMGVGDRLALFWRNHFAVDFNSAAIRSAALEYEDTVIRRHMAGPFSAMLKAVVRHPGMLLYLSQARSIGPNSRVGRRLGRGVNEDLARELMELHTIGLGAGYAQADVRELALTLTGLSVAPGGRFAFRGKWAEPGARTVMGRIYDQGGLAAIDAALEDLAAHPATAERICLKLARHYTSDEPDMDLARALTAAWRRSDGRLSEVYLTLFDHPAPRAAFGAKVKAPVDYVVSALRSVGADPADLRAMRKSRRRALLGALAAMGQVPFRPKSPEGWSDEATAWISAGQLAARHQFAQGLASLARRQDPEQVARAALGAALRPVTLDQMRAVQTPEQKLLLLFASPEFNRR